MNKNPDDIIHERAIQQKMGIVTGDKALCACGRTYIPFSGEDVPGFCEICRHLVLLRDQAAHKEWETERARLLASPRPKLGSPFRQLWVDVRKEPWWKPARVRNRCFCGGRSADRLLRMCETCRLNHRKNLIWDSVTFRMDPVLANKLATKYGLEDYLATISGGGAEDRTRNLPPIQPTAGFIDGGKQC
jgi:hypothetical protein